VFIDENGEEKPKETVFTKILERGSKQCIDYVF